MDSVQIWTGVYLGTKFSIYVKLFMIRSVYRSGYRFLCVWVRHVFSRFTTQQRSDKLSSYLELCSLMRYFFGLYVKIFMIGSVYWSGYRFSACVAVPLFRWPMLVRTEEYSDRFILYRVMSSFYTGNPSIKKRYRGMRGGTTFTLVKSVLKKLSICKVQS